MNRSLLAALCVCALFFCAAPAAPADLPSGDGFLQNRLGGDAIAIGKLLDEVAALRAENAKLKADKDPKVSDDKKLRAEPEDR